MILAPFAWRDNPKTQTGLAIFLQAPLFSRVNPQNSLNQFVPVNIEHAIKINTINRITPQPHPVQLKPRPNPNLASAHSKTLFSRKSSSKPCKQP